MSQDQSKSRNSVVPAPKGYTATEALDYARIVIREADANRCDAPKTEMMAREVVRLNAMLDQRQDAAVSERRDSELREASADLLKWLDSKEVKDSFSQLGSLSLSHSHLAIQVSREFSEWAARVIGRFRAAVSNERSER